MNADVYQRLHDRLSQAVRRVCPAWMRNSQEDLVQAGMMAVMRIESKGEEIGDLSTSYIRKVAYTALVDAIRRRRRRMEVSLETMTDTEIPLSTDQPGPELQFKAREISAGIRECLTRIVAVRQSAVTLHLLGYKTPEVAALMGWNTKRASNLIYRGLENLRECLREREMIPE